MILLAALLNLTLPSDGSGAIEFTSRVPSGEAQAASHAKPTEWPQWRGPTRDGVSAGPAWPASLGEDNLKPLWRIELGASYAGPIVAADRVFSVETKGKAEEVVRAFDRATGKELWATSWAGAMEVPFFAARNGSWVRSTPTYDGTSLFVAGMRDVLACLDAKSGEVRWTVDFVEREGSALPSFGFVCSPLVVDDHLYVQAGGAFFKLDKKTGETVWKSLAGADGMDSAFSSPVLRELNGRNQLLVQTRADLHGVNPETGEPYWSTPVKTFRGMNILTPTVFDGGVFTSSYGSRSQLLSITPEKESGDVHVAQAWENRTQGYMSSPVIVDGHAYLFQRSNRLACLRLEDGQETWVSPPTGDSYWSLIARGDRILALADTGKLYLLAADPAEYKILDERQLTDQETWAHLAVAGEHVFVRELNALAAYSWK